MRVPMRGTGAERPVVAEKPGKPEGAKGSRHSACIDGQPRKREESSSQAKSYSISKMAVWKAYNRVKANRGAAGVDSESIEEFEKDLKSNLYKIWNRMSSGTYFPPPVRSVAIPKKDGGERRLGIPTVSDRIAQAVVKLYLEPEVESQFHDDSYGYRPRKSAVDALAVTRQRCWRYDWAIDLDIRGFFDNLDHALVMRAVGKYTQCPWILLYVKRWLQAPVQLADGTRVPRTKGTPQGGVVSPLLANIFLHLAFDDWMRTTHPDVPFERYADDIVAHCKTEKQAQQVLANIKRRLQHCRLEVHPEKTRIVYCKDDDRKGRYPEEKFTFLVSPPATEGPRITGITGAQEPTRWQRSSSSPCALAERSRERRGRLPEMAALRNGLLSGEGAFRLWAPDCGSPFRRGRSVRNARSAARR
jgi:group II intron reverse transcriptase/maturase